MKSIAIILCTVALAGAGAAEPKDTPIQSLPTPGRISRTVDGWNVERSGTRRFVPDHRLKEVPAEVAPISAIFPGRTEKRPWGWAIYTREGRVDVFRKTDGFSVTTSKETFHALRTGDGGFRLSPGRTGVREISPEDINFNRR
ncbi:MAG TPA: hypothetical protein PKE12_04915 [Kiritimatiellia bacterium]|nr:hypothetical protein [Kiritimatiellia bacterium]